MEAAMSDHHLRTSDSPRPRTCTLRSATSSRSSGNDWWWWDTKLCERRSLASTYHLSASFRHRALIEFIELEQPASQPARPWERDLAIKWSSRFVSPLHSFMDVFVCVCVCVSKKHHPLCRWLNSEIMIIIQQWIRHASSLCVGLLTHYHASFIQLNSVRDLIESNTELATAAAEAAAAAENQKCISLNRSHIRREIRIHLHYEYRNTVHGNRRWCQGSNRNDCGR